MKNYKLDRQNNPVETTMMDAMNWREKNPNRCRVGWTSIGEHIDVSTVFLPLDHSWNGGPPVLWETMVFGLEDEICERYTSYADAVAGHARIVTEISKRHQGSV